MKMMLILVIENQRAVMGQNVTSFLNDQVLVLIEVLEDVDFKSSV